MYNVLTGNIGVSAFLRGWGGVRHIYDKRVFDSGSPDRHQHLDRGSNAVFSIITPPPTPLQEKQKKQKQCAR